MEEHVVVRILSIVLAAILVASCSADSDSSHELSMSQLEQDRVDKDEYFRNGEHSPLPAEQREGFTGLPYYPFDAAFVVTAVFTPSPSAETFKMATTKNDLRDAYRVGTLSFSIDGTACSLTAFRFVGSDQHTLFLPFKDATTGDETYGTGRYLDLDVVEGAEELEIDFNQAYNPYCAYNENYSCPLVPSENTLPVAITVGEKSWEMH